MYVSPAVCIILLNKPSRVSEMSLPHHRNNKKIKALYVCKPSVCCTLSSCFSILSCYACLVLLLSIQLKVLMLTYWQHNYSPLLPKQSFLMGFHSSLNALTDKLYMYLHVLLAKIVSRFLDLWPIFMVLKSVQH